MTSRPGEPSTTGSGNGVSRVPSNGQTRRWVVERTYAWLSQNRRMCKDYERLCATGEAFVYAAMSRLMVRRLARS
jgi:hypothetical protein